MGLWNLLEALLLVVNAICVLNEQRFLSKFGWSRQSLMTSESYGHSNNNNIKYQLFNLLHSIRTVITVPLIIVNIVVIFFKLVVG